MRAYLFLTRPVIIFCLFLNAACNSHDAGNKQDDKPVIDTESARQLPRPEPVKRQDVERCFSNDGLKYATTITIFTEDSRIRGNVKSTDLESGKEEKTKFTGTVDGNKLTVDFRGAPPVVGAASEWTDKTWTLDNTGGTEKLHIIFKAKNYETNKWEEMVYEFLPCKK
jgi:hypothetical protein